MWKRQKMTTVEQGDARKRRGKFLSVESEPDVGFFQLLKQKGHL
jgi:hypothetical protein